MTEQSPWTDEAALQPVATGTIVVGHDGSAAAQQALATALDLAGQLRAPVAIVRAWSFATAPRPPDWAFGYVPSSDQLQEAVHGDLISDVHHLVERFPDVQITYRAVHGGPAHSLIAMSVSARMLVVGSRGLGGVAQLMLGSVSDEVIKKACCPVLVVKQPES
jgi:nucleotide-binding universal stress UspA family protein